MLLILFIYYYLLMCIATVSLHWIERLGIITVHFIILFVDWSFSLFDFDLFKAERWKICKRSSEHFRITFTRILLNFNLRLESN